MADVSDLALSPEAAMLDAMTAVGLRPIEADLPLVADGNLRRFRVEPDKPGARNGYYVLHGDGVPAGQFGSWKTGHDQTWSAKAWRELTAAERSEQRKRIEQSRQRAESELRARQARAAREAERRWQAAEPADRCHPYLLNKEVGPYCARQSGIVLILPIVRIADDRLMSLQTITHNGEKRMLPGGAKKGHAIPVCMPESPSRVIICEGFATGCTLVEMTERRDVVLAAIDAGNLTPVALEARRLWPRLSLVIAADDDRKHSDSNPGIEAGRAAAIATGARMIRPSFREGAPVELSDFNDWANAPEWQGGVE